MSKLIPLLFAGTGAAAVSVGGAYLIKNSGSGSANKVRGNNETEVDNSPEKQAPTFSFADVNAFKNSNVMDVECIKDFTGLSNLKGDDAAVKTISGSANKIDGTFIGTSGETNVSKGCLMVNGNRKEYADGKWNGSFKLLGTFEKNGKGFISFVVAKEKESKKLGLTGIFYALTKTGDSWSITHKKEISTQKEIYKNDSKLEQNFPKVGAGLVDLNGQNWGKMFSSQDDLENICVSSENNCTNSSSEKILRGYWTWQGSGETESKQLGGGTGNLSSGWNNLYVTDEINIPAIASEQKGTGTKISVVGPNT